MGNIYTISELCSLLSVTRPIVEKRLLKLGFDTDSKCTTKIINNREIKAYELSQEQEHAIGIEKILNTHNEPHIETPIEQSNINQVNESTVLEIIKY